MPFRSVSADPSPAEAQMAQNMGAVLQMLSGHWVAQTVRAAADLRLCDHVAAGAHTAEEVARKESSDPGTTYRLMRACASLGLLAYEGQRRFSLTPLGQVLREDVPGSLRETALMQGAHGHWQAWGLFPEAVREGRTQADRALGSSMFDYLAQHPGEAALFSKAMANMTGLIVADTVALLDLAEAGTVADIGAADGSLLLALMQANPGIEGVAFDLPHVTASAQQAADKAGLSDRFTTVAGDFFDSVPKADYYLLKWILHDWTDEQCLTILRNCRRAADAGARALVIETLVGDIGKPDPAAMLDMNMLAASEGQERDLEEFDALFAASGWRRTGVSPTHSLYSLVELEAV